MGSAIFSLLFFGLTVAVSATDDPELLMSPDVDRDVIYEGLTDAEKMSLKDIFINNRPMQADKKFVEGEYQADTVDDNCRCSLDEPSCTCLFQISFINLNVMYAVGYIPEDRSVTLTLALDSYIIVNDRIKISVNEPYKPPCMPLPPPTYWLTGCFEMKMIEDQVQRSKFTLCGTLDLEVKNQDGVKHVSSMDFRCFVHATVKGEDRLEIKGHSVEEGDVAIKNVRVSKGFEHFAQEFNMLKMVRLMKKPAPGVDDDSLEEPFWNELGPFDYKPPEERMVWRSGNPNKTTYKNNWWLLGVDETPYLAILFKGFVAPKLASAQGIEDFEMIKEAVNEATEEKRADWHQSVIPDVFEPGLSCGGALLTPNKVLTICACIKTFYHVNKYKQKPISGPGPDSKFDIKVDEGENIFLEFSLTQFTGRQYHHLERQPSTLFSVKSSCFKLIESGSEGQQAEMVVLPFTPRIPSHNPFLYVLWPPYPIHVKYKQRPSSNLVAFGMRNKEMLNFTDHAGRLIDPKITAVSLLIKRDKMTDYCIKETFQKSQEPEPFKMKTTCFHSRDPKYQLCKGLIGFPITVGDELAGLSASPMDCDSAEGSMMGAVFDDGIVKEIETYLGKDLKTRRTAAHAYLYREPGQIVHVIPDYSTSDATPKPREASARRVACSASLVIFLVILGSLIDHR